MGLRVVFAGTSEFALPSLQALSAGPHQVICVVTQPDRPAGRGRRPRPTAVKQMARGLGLNVSCPPSVRDPSFQEHVRRLRPDALVVAAFGQILPGPLLRIPRLGAVNVHPSLLPRYRGAAPIQRAVLNGERTTGVTVILMDEGMDSGPILLQRQTHIGEEEDAAGLSQRLARLGAELLMEALGLMERAELHPTPQREEEATYAPPIRKEEGLIEWAQSAQRIHNQVRAMVPWPGAYTFWRGGRLKIHKARVGRCEAAGVPGRVMGLHDGALRVAAGHGCLDILEIQPENRPRMSSSAFFQGHRDILGEILGK